MAQTTLSLKAKDENNRDREEAALACNTGPWQGPQQELGQEASRAAAGAGQSGWGAGWELGGGTWAWRRPPRGLWHMWGSLMSCPQPGGAGAGTDGR